MGYEANAGHTTISQCSFIFFQLDFLTKEQRKYCWFKKQTKAERHKERHQNRLYKRTVPKKKRSGKRQYKGVNRRRFASVNERLLIIEMTKIQSLRLRLTALENQIKRLGGFRKRRTWKQEYIAKIESLHQERKQIKHELKEYQPYAQLKNAYNCSPYQVAKQLKFDATIVYRTIRIYAWTGDVRFSRDRRSHVSTHEAKENLSCTQKAGYLGQEWNRSLVPPSHSESGNVAALLQTPLGSIPKLRNNVKSKRIRHSQSQLAQIIFLRDFDPPIADDEEAKGKINQNVEDYYRLSTAHYSKVYYGFGRNKTFEVIEEFDTPPLTYTNKQRDMDMGFIEKDGLNLTELGLKIYHPQWVPKPKEYYEA